MTTLFTIGYERAAMGEFLATLRSAGIGMVVDVRDVPFSRKPGFSKKALAQHLEQAGIGYRHLGALGTPKPGRDAAHRGDRAVFEGIMQERLNGAEAQIALAQVAELAASVPTCLLCFERDPAACHRTMIAAAVAEGAAFRVTHFFVHPDLLDAGPLQSL